jgi:hypothetical protein
MKGIISFHPLDLGLFERFITPLIAGEKIAPQDYLDQAIRLRDNLHRADAMVMGIRHRMESAAPPKAENGAPLWKKLKARLDAMEHQVDETTMTLQRRVEPDLHLEGRPFFIAEGSARKVAEFVDEYRTAGDSDQVDALAREQLIRLDRRLAGAVEPSPGKELSNAYNYRQELLDKMKTLYDLMKAARSGGDWPDRNDRRIKADRVVEKELPWRALYIHSRAVPFWQARDVDGLETVCRAGGVDPPNCLVPAWGILAAACSEYPGLRKSMQLELSSDHSVGGYVPPEEIPDLLGFLNLEGAKIIQEATRQGAGPTCTLLLKKIRECATYAEQKGAGYLEAAGLVPPHLDS